MLVIIFDSWEIFGSLIYANCEVIMYLFVQQIEYLLYESAKAYENSLCCSVFVYLIIRKITLDELKGGHNVRQTQVKFPLIILTLQILNMSDVLSGSL